MSASTEFDFTATTRNETGKKAARRLRSEHKIPAVVYGADKKPQAIFLQQNDVRKALSHEAVFSHILNLIVDGKSEKVILKAMKRHQTKPLVMHMDFFRIKAGEKITMNVPLHFIGEEECPGIKEGGVVSHLLNDIELKCLPENLPEFIEVDISKLELDQSIHLSAISLPKGTELTIEITEENDPSLASIHRPRVEEEPVEEKAGEEEGVEAAAEGEEETAEGEKGEAAEGEQAKKEDK